MRYFADQLAEQGYICLRFDYLGTGDSSLDLSRPIQSLTWIDNIASEIQFLKDKLGINSISLIGLRLGASLAALYAALHPVNHLILWNPCISGRRYIREIQTIGSLSQNAIRPQQNLFESAGVAMHSSIVADLKKIDLLKLDYSLLKQSNSKILLAERDDISSNEKFLSLLKDNKLNSEQITFAGYEDMMAEPHDTIIPKNAIEKLIRWLNSTHSAQLQIDKPNVIKPSVSTNINWANTTLKETICLIGHDDIPMHGILTQAPAVENENRPLIILSNSGSAHRVGPNRLYVELARQLAIDGFSTLRLDIANLGDSFQDPLVQQYSAEIENHPYPEHAIDNVNCAIEWMKSQYGFKHFLLAGLCSGSHTSFHAGLELSEQNIRECILINPLTFYWQPGMSLEIPHAYKTIKDAKYYQYAIKDLDKWIKFIKGQAQTGYIIRFALKLAKEKIGATLRTALEIMGIKKRSNLAEDLKRYQHANRHLSFFFSTTDPGYNILLSEAKKITINHIRTGEISMEFIEDADHTFSKQKSRTELINKLSSHLLKRY